MQLIILNYEFKDLQHILIKKELNCSSEKHQSFLVSIFLVFNFSKLRKFTFYLI